MGRKRRQYLTEELASEIDNIRSLPSYARADVMRRGREVLDETLKRLNDDMADLLWFINRPDDYDHIHRHEFGSRLEAIMPRGPPQDTRELGSDQRRRTMDHVEAWSRTIKEADSKMDEVLDNLRLMGLFYQLRGPFE